MIREGIAMNAAIVDAETHRAWRYAQRAAGLQLHIAEMYADGTVETVAMCGVRALENWRLTITVPLGRACKRCTRCFGEKEKAP